MKKNNGVKIYSVIITLTAAILAVVLILVAGFHERSGRANEDTAPSAAVTEVTDTRVSEETGPAESHSDQNESKPAAQEPCPLSGDEFNVSGKVGWEDGNDDMQNVINAWGNMLRQLDIDADIAFIGDSITNRGDFQQYFPDRKTVNLGCGGDTIRGVYNRTIMLSYVHPEKVIVMCGVNVLRNDNIDDCTVEYAGLLNSIQEYIPDSEVYVMSILPMSQDWQDMYCTHETTEQFNLVIKQLAEKRNMTYVDLYSAFEKNGEIDPDLAVDGIHLSPLGYDTWMNEIYRCIYG